MGDPLYQRRLGTQHVSDGSILTASLLLRFITKEPEAQGAQVYPKITSSWWR
jgi:hypothetical protein